MSHAPTNDEVQPYINPLDPRFRSDPYELFRAQREHSSGHWNPVYQGWGFCDYASVKEILVARHTSADRVAAIFARLPPEVLADIQDVLDHLRNWALMSDGEQHRRLRYALNQAFMPRLVKQLEGRMHTMLDDVFAGLPERGSLDVIADLAVPFPAQVIAAILGVPGERMEWFKECSIHIARLFTISSRPDPELAYRGQQSLRELIDYVAELIKLKEAQPGEDMVSAMLFAEENGKKLSRPEIEATLSLLLVAGHETTTNLIGNGMLALLQHPEAYSELRCTPELIPQAVEEMLRWNSPVQVTARVMQQPMRVNGIDMAPGERAMLFLGAANRDPAVFSQPDAFDIHRKENPHLAFGNGGHFCVGSPLARLEATMMFKALTSRLPEVHLATEELVWSPDPTLRGLHALPISWMAI